MSTSRLPPGSPSARPHRSRLLRGSALVQVAQPQPMTGTPTEVPVPKKHQLPANVASITEVERACRRFGRRRWRSCGSTDAIDPSGDSNKLRRKSHTLPQAHRAAERLQRPRSDARAGKPRASPGRIQYRGPVQPE